MRGSDRCPVCGSSDQQGFLRQARVPVLQNIQLPTQGQAREVMRGDVSMTACSACGFVHNAAFDPKLIAYSSNYDNTQSCSPAFSAHMDDMVRHLVVNRGVRNARIVEIGAGQGLFLRRLVELAGGDTVGIGFDPAYRGPERDLEGRVRFEQRLYDESCGDLNADVVICRHVIEHIPNPVALLEMIAGSLTTTKRPKVFLETPDVTWILENQVVWDFFYEHCSLFTADSLRTACERAGLVAADSRGVFGGQYLWLEATTSAAAAPSRPSAAAGRIPVLARNFGANYERRCAQWRDEVEQLRERGGVALWGAGAKGVTFANMVDPAGAMLACVVDVNPNKQNRFLPGTGHPIVDYRELPAYGVRSAILMNPNYRAENEGLLRAASIDVDLRILDAAPPAN